MKLTRCMQAGNKSLFIAAILCFSLAVTAGSARAAPFSNSSVMLDWSTLSVSIPHTLLGSWTETSNAVVNADSSLEPPASDSGVHPVATVTGATAEGWTPAFVGHDPGALVDVVAPAAGESASGDANSYFTAGNAILGSGTISISIDYTISHDLGTDVAGDLATSYAYALLGFQITTPDDPEFLNPIFGIDDSSTYLHQFFYSVADGDDASTTYSDTLTVSAAISTLDYDYLLFGYGTVAYTEAFAEAAEGETPIPEPATLLLLGSGLIGIAGFGRKRGFGKNSS